MGVPAYNPLTRYAMAIDLSVEVNTWFLIMRRMPIALRDPVKKLVGVPFYITWYFIRCVLYPYMIFDVYNLWQGHVHRLKAAGDPTYERARYGLTYMFIPPLFQ